MSSNRSVTTSAGGGEVTAVEVSGQTQQYSSMSYTLSMNGDPDVYASPLEGLVEELNLFTARILGRANDLHGDFDDTAQQFSDVLKWSIQNFSEEDLALWSEVSSNMSFCAAIVENWKDAVKTYKDERLRIINRWNEEAPTLAADLDKAPPRIQFIWNDSPAEAAEKALASLKQELEGEEQTAYQLFKETGEQLSDDLKDGPTAEAVGRLMEGGYVTWSQFNLGGSAADLPDDVDPVAMADSIVPYVNGDKELDDDYYEMLAVLSAIGWRAEQANSVEGQDMDPEDMEFLKEFYDQLEGGPVPVADLARLAPMDEFMGEDAVPLLAALGTGILVLSDPRLKNGDDSVPGGYYDLPASVRAAVEGDPDFGMRDIDWEAVGNLFGHVPEGVEGGRGLSLTLGLTVGHELSTQDTYFLSPETIEHMQAALGVATRNDGANADMISGPGDWFEHPRLGDVHEDEKREAAFEAILTNQWPDNGAAASGYTDWIMEARQEAGDDTRAVDETARDLIEFLTDDERYERMTDLTGGMYTDHYGESGLSFTQVNHEMANGLVNVFGAYVDDFGLAGEEGVTISDRSGAMLVGDEEKVRFLEFIAGSPEAATSMTAISEMNAHQGVTEMMSGDQYASVEGDERSRLTRAINEALVNEASSRLNSETEARIEAHERKVAGRELFVDLLFKPADLIDVKNPVAGLVVGELVDAAKTAATDAATSGLDLQLPPPPEPTAEFDDSVMGNTVFTGSAIVDHYVRNDTITAEDLEGYEYLSIENGELKVEYDAEIEATVRAEIVDLLADADDGLGGLVLESYLEGFQLQRVDDLGELDPELAEELQRRAEDSGQ
ncbi:TPR repeat region-containing protein [Nocardiopsis ganjiahuensis]|uniref:TPR repeat region-containing protein n=1 Tax=Nocardiopsis ganjiahuensis TaxID=239984 RepID=UPI001269796F|nr:hypothetical protein [Nocardiopsis ganjiahuensis]